MEEKGMGNGREKMDEREGKGEVEFPTS